MKRLCCWAACLLAVGCAPPVAGSVAELRPTDVTSSEMWRFAPGEVVESFDGPGGMVRVFFTRAGVNAVPAGDVDGGGVPDAVEQVASTYEEALSFYLAAGFRPPVSDLGTAGGDGGDGRFDVYLVDFALRADGSYRRERCTGSICSGYMVQENDFTGYAYPSFAVGTRVLASHELFHAVQAAYDADTGANFSEATAVWATEQFDPSLDDFEGFIGAWARMPERSLDQEPLSPADGFSYGVSIFFQYLTERHGPEIVLEIWEAMEDGAGGVADPAWLPTTERVLADHGVASFAEAFHEFASWTLYAGLGGPDGATFAAARDYPAVTRDTGALPFMDDALRVYTTSMGVWSFTPGERTQLTAALVGEAAEIAPLAVFVAVRNVSTIRVERLTVLDGSVSTSVAGADDVIVVVANGAIEGSSARPGLCVGSPAEVASCRGTLLGTDAGVSDAGLTPSDAAADAGPVPPPSGCSCRAAGATASPVGPALALSVLGLLLALRRRR